MLPSSERLRRKSVFQRAYKERRSVSSPQVSLYVLPKVSKRSNPNKLNTYWRPLVGFVVSKKTEKSACKRNRVKRQTREAYRLLSRSIYDGQKSHFGLREWYAIVFVIHPKALTSTFDEIAKSVESCLIRAEKKYGQANSARKQKSKDDQDVKRSANSITSSNNNI